MTQKGPEGANGAKNAQSTLKGLNPERSCERKNGAPGQRATKSYFGALSSAKETLRFKPR